VTRRITWLLVPLLILPATACGLGEKEAYADRVIAAPRAAIERGTVAGTITSYVELVKAPFELDQATGRATGFSTPFVADLGAHRSQLETSQLLHDDLVIHLRRADAEENDARPFITLDVTDLPENAGLPFQVRGAYMLPFAVFTLPPTVLVDLMGGALTGSLRSLGTDDIDGTRVTGYSGRFDLDKMVTDTFDDEFDDDRTEGVEHAFDILDIPGRVHAGKVWLDGDGLPRRFEITFDQKPRRQWTFEVTMTIDFLAWGDPVAFEVPGNDDTIRIGSLSRLTNEIGASFRVDGENVAPPAVDPEAIPETTPDAATTTTVAP
jgi:hypothetical protein